MTRAASSRFFTIFHFNHMFAELFVAIFTLWTWPFFVFWTPVMFVLLMSIAAADMYWPIGFVILALGGAATWQHMINPLTYVATHPWVVAASLGLYIVIGLVWVAFLWMRYIEHMRPLRIKTIQTFLQDFDAKRSTFLFRDFDPEWRARVASTGFAPVDGPKELNTALLDYLKRDSDKYSQPPIDLGTATDAPQWEKHQSRFQSKFLYWPFDAVVYLLHDVLVDVWNVVSGGVTRLFNHYATGRMTQQIENK